MPTTDKPREVEVVSPRSVAGGIEKAGQAPGNPWGWAVWSHPHSGTRHFAPTWDIRAHHLDTGCACRPELDETGCVHHKSFDGREPYEQGTAQRH